MKNHFQTPKVMKANFVKRIWQDFLCFVVNNIIINIFFIVIIINNIMHNLIYVAF